MSVYPMEIVKTSLEHKGGTKDYFLTLVVNALGQGILIKRFGSKGATGQVKVETYPSAAAAEAAYEKNMDIRQSGSKGYRVTDSKILQAEKREQLSLMIGRAVFPKIGGSNVKHLDPDYDVAGMREPESNRDDDGNFIGDQARHVSIDPDVVRRAELAEKEKELAAMKVNPKFGRF